MFSIFSRTPAHAGVALALVLAACNAAPTAPVLGLLPAEPTTTDGLELRFLARSQDPDGADVVSYDISWTLDGEPLDDLAGAQQVPALRTRKGQEWAVVVVPSDADGKVGQAGQAVAVIGNTPPTATVNIQPSIPQPNQELTALTQGRDVDGDEITWRYLWSVDGEPTEYTERVLPGDLTSKGDVWSVQAWPSDGDDEGDPAEDAVSIDNAPPVGVEVLIEPSEAFTDSVLTAVPEGTDEDGDVLTWSYVWLRGGEPIPGIDAAEIDGSFFEKNDQIIVEATPNDGFVDGEPVRSSPLRIRNTPPSVTAAAVSPDSAFTDSVMSCLGSGFSDLDGDPEGYRYSWRVDGVERGNDASLDGINFAKGDDVLCELTAFDGQDPGNTVRAEPVRIQNTPPTLDAVTIDNPEPTAADTLGAVLTGLFDADDDDITLRYQWRADGVDVGTDPTLSPDRFTRGQELTVEVTPIDSDGAEGESVRSAGVTILNSIPVMDALTVGPDPAFTMDSLVATASASDPDGDELTLRYAWTVNSSEAGTDAPTLDASSFFKGDRVRVRVAPFDGEDEGEPLYSSFITIQNSLPVIEAAVVDPEEILVATEAECIPEGWSDADDDEESYRYAWLVDDDVVNETSLIAEGDLVRGDEVVCRITPFDGEDEGDAVFSDPITVGNTPPVLSAVSLSTAEPREGDTVFVTLEGAFDADDDPISFAYAWFVDDTLASTADELTSDLFAKDQEIYVVVTPSDGFDAGTSATSERVTVGNTPPVITSVTLAPSSPRTLDGVTATVAASDVDAADTLTYDYDWYVDGDLAASTGATLAAADYTKGQTIYVEVTANDGDDDSLARRSATVRAVNTPPSISSVAIAPSAGVTAGTTLTCTPSGWSDDDDDTEGYRYEWRVDGTLVSSAATLSSGYRAGNTVTCRATPFDGEDEGAALTSAAVTVDNSAPSLASVTLSSLTPVTTDTLSVTLGAATDDDGDDITFTYTWSVNGSVVASSSTLAPDQFERGDEVFVTVTPSDGTTDGTPVSSAVATVQNSTPVVHAVTLSPASPTTLSTVVASVDASDVDGDSLTYTYTWYIDEVEASSATGSSLSSALFERGEDLRVEVTATDGDLTSEARTSATIEVVNSPPSITSVTLDPATFDVDDTITCVPTGWSDADDDEPGYVYAWQAGTTTLAETSSELSGSDVARGDRVRCIVTPDDGVALGDAVSSARATVENSPPTLASVAISPASADVTDGLSASLGATDDSDGDTVTLRYAWRVNGALVATTATLSAGVAERDDEVQLTVTPYDGVEEGEPQVSAVLVIDNAPPVLTSVTIDPDELGSDTNATALFTASDPDGDTLTATYQWFVDSVEDATTATLPSSALTRGAEVYVTVTVDDGTASPVSLSSDTLTVVNAPPSITGVTLSAAEFDVEESITCTPSGWSDPDGDEAGYLYEWRAGATVLAETSSTLSGSDVERGDEVRCTVTPDDGVDTGEPVTSDPATVVNSPPALASVAIDPASPTSADELSATLGATSDPDGDTVTLRYSWAVGETEIGTAATLPAGVASRDDEVVLTVTPFDGIEEGSPVVSAAVTILNAPPTLADVAITPGELFTDTPATASYTADDADGDTLTITVQWYVNSTADATTATLASSAFVKADEVYFTVTADDGDAAPVSVSSATITVSNSAPTTPGIEISPGAPLAGEAVLCSIITGEESTDADGDTIDYVFDWYVDELLYEGAVVDTATSSELPADTTVATEDWVCEVSAIDDDATPAASAPAEIAFTVD